MIGLTIAKTSNASQLNCDFLDSINITDGVSLPNKSILFNDMEFQPHHYAEIDHFVSNETKTEVPKHIRGCPCHIRSCVRLCCPYGTFADEDNVVCEKDEGFKNVTYDVHFGNNGENKTIKLAEHFGFVGKICDDLYYADKNDVRLYEVMRKFCLEKNKQFFQFEMFTYFRMEPLQKTMKQRLIANIASHL